MIGHVSERGIGEASPGDRFDRRLPTNGDLLLEIPACLKTAGGSLRRGPDDRRIRVG
jgi:hypothetical protein